MDFFGDAVLICTAELYDKNNSDDTLSLAKMARHGAEFGQWLASQSRFEFGNSQPAALFCLGIHLEKSACIALLNFYILKFLYISFDLPCVDSDCRGWA